MATPRVHPLCLPAILWLLVGCMLIPSGCARFDGVVDFTADPTSGKRPLAVQFSPVVEGSVRKWIWGFGDGHTSTERSPEHTYVDPGVYTVILTVVPRLGDPVTVSKVDYVTATAGFGAAPGQLVAQDDAFILKWIPSVHTPFGTGYVLDVLVNDASSDPTAELTIVGVRDRWHDEYESLLLLDSGTILVSHGDVAEAGKRLVYIPFAAWQHVLPGRFFYLVTDGQATAQAEFTIDGGYYIHPD